MNKIAIAFLAAVSLASFGCKKKGGGEAMDAMKKYKTDLCACKDHDIECGKKASDAYMKSQSENAGKAADMSAKPDPDMEKLQTEIADCTKRVMTPDTGAAGGAAGTPPAGGAPAGGSDTAPAAGGAAPAGGSDGSAAAPAAGGAAPAAGSGDGSGSAK
jgi:hypothetical protein